MKTKNLFLSLLLIITFGNCDLFAQTVQQTAATQTVKAKRKYTKKVKPEASASTSSTMSASDAATKPKRKYTKKVKVDNSTNVAPAQTTAATVEMAKPKRTYTRKTPTVTATTSAPVAKTTYQPKKVAAQKAVYQPTSGGTAGNHQILVGPRGGKYYINKNGNKTYVK